jgi:hypothetical protein
MNLVYWGQVSNCMIESFRVLVYVKSIYVDHKWKSERLSEIYCIYAR